MKKVSDGFKKLMQETDGVGPALMQSVMLLSEVSALSKKEQEIAYIAVLTATKMYGGLPFHIQHAKELGATKEEVKSAMLVSLPLMGIQVADALEFLDEYDIEYSSKKM